MKFWFRLLSMALVFSMLLLAGAGCAKSGVEKNPGEPEAPAGSDENPETPGTSGDANEPAPDIWSAVRARAVSDAGIKVLFIGDSLTYYNKMPSIFDFFCKAGGKKVTVDSLTKGGTTISMMRDDAALWTQITNKITLGNWDIVVLETGRNRVVMPEYFPESPWKEYSAAKELADMVREAGAIPLVYSTFGVTEGSVTRDGFTKVMTREEHTDLVTAYGAAVAELLDCKAVYVGETFQAAYENMPSINLYHTDNRHPSLEGSYLIAADFYTVIFDESPEGLNYSGGVEAELAAFLREQAALLLEFVPSEKAELKEYTAEKTFSLDFGRHGFSNVAAAGNTNVVTVLGDDHAQYIYQSGQKILSSFAKINGAAALGNTVTAEAKISFGKYGGSGNPSGGFILATEDGKMIRLYARTDSINVRDKDCSTAKFEVRVDIDKENSVDLGSYDSELTMKVTVTPEALCLYVNDQLFVTMTETGSVFYDGQTSSSLKYSGQKVHPGLLFCYADVDYSNLVITAE